MATIFMNGLSEVADRVRRSTVQVESRGRGAGSGVIWRADGLVVTNAHVVRGGRAQVSLSEGRPLCARVAAIDRHLDLALLQTDAADLPAATVGDSDALRVGELIFAVGNPYGQAGTVTVGIIHAGETQRWIQSDVRLAPGNSGGPLANAEGRVIGINTMVVNRLALSIPSSIVDRFVARRGKPARRLGVTVRPVNVSGFGLLILEIEPRRPAHNAGLRVGDVIIGAAGTPFQAPFDLALAVEAASPPVVLDILRGGRQIARQMEFELEPVGAEVG
jgi:serine protease Do